MRLQARPDAAGAARRALEFLDDRVPTEIAERAQLLVSELVTNSVQHAERHVDDSIELDIRMLPASLSVEVTDSGPGFEPKISTPTMYQHSGWGLYLLDQLADRWRVSPSEHEVCVWFELDLPS
ncbi:MAG: ATP-binding protein [Actinomycetota bacterium]|nr:ATP-binding protein [Actinomycetota bacterium]